MKKVLATLLAGALAASMLIGCGASASTDSSAAAPAAEPQAQETATEASEPVAAADDAAGDVTIWYYWETAGHQEALNHIIQEFNGQQDKITVQANMFPSQISRSSFQLVLQQENFLTS